jgi:hypothetical protein
MPHPWLDTAVIRALLAMGQFETATNENSVSRADEFLAAFDEIVIAAARGDREHAGALQQAYFERPNVTDFERLQINAMLGNREEANAAAARVDQRAHLPLSLMLATLWCHCGAPFDLEATPKFAAKLQEGQLPWPPNSPIAFPLKEW